MSLIHVRQPPKKELSWNIQQWKYPWKKNSRKILKEEGHFHFRKTGNSIWGQLDATQLEDSAGTARLSSFPALLQGKNGKEWIWVLKCICLYNMYMYNFHYMQCSLCISPLDIVPSLSLQEINNWVNIRIILWYSYYAGRIIVNSKNGLQPSL